jgi:hypothetical protein
LRLRRGRVGVIRNGTSANPGPTGELEFGADVTTSSLSFNKVGNDLVIKVFGSADSVRVRWFANAYGQLAIVAAPSCG